MKVHTQARVTRVNTSEAQNLSDAKLPAGINIIRESEYDDHMVTTNKRWRESHVTEGQFTSYDGLSIRYYHAPQENAASGENFMRWPNITGSLATRFSSWSTVATAIRAGR